MTYNYKSRNLGKDKVYTNRLLIAEKLGLDIKKVGSRLYSYLMAAELGIILN